MPEGTDLKRVLKDRAKTSHGRRAQGKVTVGHECRIDDGRTVAYNASIVEREERKKTRRRGEWRRECGSLRKPLPSFC